jgi:serine protease Do
MDMLNQPVPGRGVGTGVILDQQGHILTNNHVIDGAQSVTVTLSNGKSFPAQVVGGDATTDTAVIRIEAPGLRPAVLGFSSGLEVGQEVIAIGHALGLPGGPTVSKGVVSALDRSIQVDAQTTMVDLIQTDAAINPGNSGGPLLTTRAEVIGINTAAIRGSQGISFAINIDDAKIVVAQLMERGYIDRGFLGISPANLPPALGNQLGVPVIEGLLVVQVVPDSPAAKAGLQEEDVIVELGDEPIRNTGELSKFLIAHPPGDTVTVVYFRGSEKRRTQVTLAERPKS